MAVNLNFRTALSGFHREDVVRYIEYTNSTHAAQINQLNTELQELRAQNAALVEKPDLSAEVESLRDQLARAEAEIAALTVARDEALAQAQEAQQQLADTAARELANMELEAYRRAEQAERNAKLRAEQIYQQATGTLAQATTQVDTAAANFRQMAEQMNAQMAQMQQTVESSKNALLDAATTMYSIRPADITE